MLPMYTEYPFYEIKELQVKKIGALSQCLDYTPTTFLYSTGLLQIKERTWSKELLKHPKQLALALEVRRSWLLSAKSQQHTSTTFYKCGC